MEYQPLRGAAPVLELNTQIRNRRVVGLRAQRCVGRLRIRAALKLYFYCVTRLVRADEHVQQMLRVHVLPTHRQNDIANLQSPFSRRRICNDLRQRRAVNGARARDDLAGARSARKAFGTAERCQAEAAVLEAAELPEAARSL